MFRYHDSTGRDFGQHREPDPHVEGLEHYQEREPADQDYECEPTTLGADSPVELFREEIEHRLAEEP